MQAGIISFYDRWLNENLQDLVEDEFCGLGLIEPEKEVGTFSVDVFCEDERANSSIFRQKLQPEEYEQELGHLLSYAVGAFPKTLVWLSPNPQDQHRDIIKWLNAQTPDIFRWYLFKIEAIKVGNAPPMPFFSLTYNPGHQDLGITHDELVKRCGQRIKFWEALLTALNTKTKLYMDISVPKENQGTKVTGSYYQLRIRLEDGLIQLVKSF